MAFYLGIDIGGTKSHAIIADHNGNAVGFGAAGTGNHELVGYDGLRAVLRSVTDQALAQAGLTAAAIAGAGLGVAGYDWPSERTATLDAAGVLELNCPLDAVNDTMIGLMAGATRGWGIAVVGGTGENCWGRDPQGRIGRVTGNGEMMGEYGGGGTIVRRAVHAVGRTWSRRGPETALLAPLLTHTGAADIEDFIEGIGIGRYRVSSDFMPKVVEVAESGDPVAIGLLEWAGRQLADLGLGVIRQLDLAPLAFDVVQVGGMFNHAGIVRRTMERTILAEAPGARFVRLDVPPVIGGVVLGMATAGNFDPAVRDNLVRSVRDLISGQD